jgi:hypothetical protein
MERSATLAATANVAAARQLERYGRRALDTHSRPKTLWRECELVALLCVPPSGLSEQDQQSST